MVDVVYVCHKHGQLGIEGVNKNGNKYRCKACHSDQRKAHYERNKAKVLASQKKYRAENKERVLEIRRESDRRNRHKHAEKRRLSNKKYRLNHYDELRVRDRAKKRKYREELHPVYVKDKLSRGSNLSAKDIPLSLVRFKADIMKIKRSIKMSQNEQKRNHSDAVKSLEEINERK